MPTAGPASTGHSPTPAEKPLRADARRNRAKVLDVAREMFIAEGMSVPIDMIAERAGVGVGTVYRHFPTKEALFEAIMTHWVEGLTASATALADADDPGAAFVEFFTMVVDQSVGSKGLHETLIAAGIEPEAAYGELGRQMIAAMDVLLTRAKQAGAVRRDVTVADVKALITGVTAMRAYGGNAQVTLDVVLAGLRPAGG